MTMHEHKEMMERVYNSIHKGRPILVTCFTICKSCKRTQEAWAQYVWSNK